MVCRCHDERGRMSNYPIVQAYEHPDRGKCVQIETSTNGPILHVPASKASLLATRLVEVVGCEQLTEALRDAGEQAERLFLELAAERKRNEDLVALLRELEWSSYHWRGFKCPVCLEYKSAALNPAGHRPDCRLRAALEGR